MSDIYNILKNMLKFIYNIFTGKLSSIGYKNKYKISMTLIED